MASNAGTALSKKKAEEAAFFADRNAAKAAENARIRAMPCFDAEIAEDGKFMCPVCKEKEGGTLRIITHLYTCKYKYKDYCQHPKTGGMRKNRHSTKSRKIRKIRTRRNKKY